MRARAWGIGPERFREILRELRFRYLKWDTYACGRCLVLPEALVLTRRQHEEIVAGAEALSAALGRLEERVLAEPALLRELGIPRPLHRILRREPANGLQLARYDLFPTPDGGWILSEFNEDVPGGFNEAVGIPELLTGELPGLRFEGDLRRAVVEAFQAEAVAFLFATGYSEDLQHMLLLQRWLEQDGRETRLGSPAHLEVRRRRPTLAGWPFGEAFRFYPGEWLPLLPNLRTWRRVGAELRTMNPLRRLIRQSKKSFALWRERDLLDGEDRELLNRYTPASFSFRPQQAPRLRAEQDRWVLKHAFGRMGDAVVIGALVSRKEWEAALVEAVRSPGDYLAQERFHVPTLPFESGPLYPTVGVYVVNGRFAGYYSRAAPRPFLTHEAYHVATLVEDP